MEENQNTIPIQNPVPEQPPVTPLPPVEKPKPKFPTAIIIGIILFLLIAGSAAGFYVFKQQSLKTAVKSTPSLIVQKPTSIPDPTANWEKYTNTKNGFSLRYPKEWQISGAPNTSDVTQSGIVRLASPCNYQGGDYCSQLNFSITPYVQEKLFDPIFIIDISNGGKVLSKQTIKVDGADALEEIYFQSNYGNGVGKTNGILNYLLVIEHNPIKIVATYSEGNKTLLMKTPDQWKNKKVLDQILTTFKFTN